MLTELRRRRSGNWVLNETDFCQPNPTTPLTKEGEMMRRADYMIGFQDFGTLKAEQLMQDVVSYYHTGGYGREGSGGDHRG
jgi:hypothetical protein